MMSDSIRHGVDVCVFLDLGLGVHMHDMAPVSNDSKKAAGRLEEGPCRRETAA